MPIEIREVIIRANLEKKSPKKETGKSLDSKTLEDLKEEIIEVCMEKLQTKMQRHFKL